MKKPRNKKYRPRPVAQPSGRIDEGHVYREAA
ncbi:hypothetical protein LO55_5044 [Massilia timonae]|uniref:Uncharacterized protein n=1 Tax=Massilia timonae TaxID=47229 RepID=A0A1S2N412_9BURK|nr:hypothetical protein LO55_5044 [Massilia timonae]